MGFNKLMDSLTSLRVADIRENARKEETIFRESNSTLRRKMELDSNLTRQRNADHSKIFRLFLSNFFEGRRDKARYRAHKRSIKESAKQQRRTIALQRGYW